MDAREMDAANERKAKHKTNLIFQISLSWNFCKELFRGCLESENLTLLKGKAKGQLWKNLQKRSKDLIQVSSSRSKRS